MIILQLKQKEKLEVIAPNLNPSYILNQKEVFEMDHWIEIELLLVVDVLLY
jgi:hypothetical protein